MDIRQIIWRETFLGLTAIYFGQIEVLRMRITVYLNKDRKINYINELYMISVTFIINNKCILLEPLFFRFPSQREQIGCPVSL